MRRALLQSWLRLRRPGRDGGMLFSSYHEKRLQDPSGELVQVDDYKEAGAVVTRSFCGTLTTDPEWATHWMFGPQLSAKMLTSRSSPPKMAN